MDFSFVKRVNLIPHIPEKMKIIFICGSIEPGEDGVGDYTRRLAGELIRQGRMAVILAFNDRRAENLQRGFQMDKQTSIGVMRLPAHLNDKTRYLKAKEFINTEDPEWISLQFVPFSFNNKGLPLSLGWQLRKLGATRKWHVMFHELWVGLPSPLNLKQRLYGLLQKKIIMKVVSGIAPSVITTTIPLYYNNLSFPKVGILPLFGNIGITGTSVEEKGIGEFVAVHFGTCTAYHGDWRKQLEWLKKYSQGQQRQLKLEIIGSGGPCKEKAVQVGEEVIGKEFIHDLGWMTPAEISRRFLRADMGISRAGNIHYGKSGSTIAMLEHGLPVLLRGNRNENRDMKFSEKDNLVYVDDSFSVKAIRSNPESRSSKVAELFLKYLQ